MDWLGRRPQKKRERLFLKPGKKRLHLERLVPLAVISGLISDDIVIGHALIERAAHIISGQTCFFSLLSRLFLLEHGINLLFGLIQPTIFMIQEHFVRELRDMMVVFSIW